MKRLAWLAAGALWLTQAACTGEAKTPGALMLAVSTDMYVDRDVDRIDIVVQPEFGMTQVSQFNLYPALDGLYLPGTFSIVEGDHPGEHVRVRVIARGRNTARVVREAAVNLPRNRTALLPMPIQWLCDGQVRQDGQLVRSDCDEGYTCKLGVCERDAVAVETLPEYSAPEVFGGGTATGGGTCFDTTECLSVGPEPAVNMDDCVLAVPVTDDLNVALVLPPGSSGHCSEEECLIPLDRSLDSGWYEREDGNLQLPPSVCARVSEGNVRVRVTTDCASKTPGTPTCGPWTLVGQVPGGFVGNTDGEPDAGAPGGSGEPPDGGSREGEPDAGQPIDPVDPPVEPPPLTELSKATQRALDDAAQACALLGQQAPPQLPVTSQTVANLCSTAKSRVETLSSLDWFVSGNRCYSDTEAQLACERSCDPSCDPGGLRERCEQYSISGVCDGPCDSRICESLDGSVISCTGYCEGTCDGYCDGNCLGQCSGTCDPNVGDGYCDGYCTDLCKGLCEGRCDGTCEGYCDGDPNLGSVNCGTTAACLGPCSGTMTDPVCEGPLGTNTCNLEYDCAEDCRALGTFGVQCDSMKTWVLPSAAITTEMHADMEAALPVLVSLRDWQLFLLIDESSILYNRWQEAGASADLLDSVQQKLNKLSDVNSAITGVLSTLPPSRNGYGTGVASCSVVSAVGTLPQIDNFDDGDTLLPIQDGRDGDWYIVRDATTGSISPDPLVPETGGPGTSTHALHLFGGGFTDWGAGVALNLRAGGAPYDASYYSGLRFWAQGTGSLQVVFRQADLDSYHSCGRCNPGSELCDGFYSMDVFLNSTGDYIDVPFGQLLPAPDVTQSFNPYELIDIKFIVPSSQSSFDFYLDDVEFIYQSVPQ